MKLSLGLNLIQELQRGNAKVTGQYYSVLNNESMTDSVGNETITPKKYWCFFVS
jgi:hypothetical protein